MSFALSWNETLATGNMFIDAQHKQLFIRAAILNDAVLSGHAGEALSDSLNFLGDYIIEHFGFEEDLMEKLEYPEIEKHKILHHGFKLEFEVLSSEIERGINPSIIASKIDRCVGEWLQNVGAWGKAGSGA